MSVPVYLQQPTVANRPMGRLDAQGRLIYDSVDDNAFQADYDGGTNLTYKGFARPGASTSAPVWQIAYLTYDGNGNVLTITWPQDPDGNASNDYEFVWADRASYTYS
jgi:YD repeat-containing protein